MISVNGILQTLIFITIKSGYFVSTMSMFKNLDNYGPYTVTFTRFDSCAGPKSTNLTNYSIDIKKVDEDYIVHFNFTYLESCHIDTIKFKSLAVEKYQKKILLNYIVNDPCRHFVFGSIIENFFRTNKCTVAKGEYFGYLNLSNITRSFYGSSAFYGEYEIRAAVTSKKRNIICFIVNIVYNKI